MTIMRRLQTEMSRFDMEDVKQYGIVAKAVCGIDGSGSHQVYNSESSLREGLDTTHILVGGFCLTKILLDNPAGDVIFKDRAPSAAEAERPLLLVPGKETREAFGQLIKLIDSDVDKLSRDPIMISISGVDIKCQVQVEMSQLDGKAITVATGLGGSYCTCCTASSSEAKDPIRIKEGFFINRDIVDIQQLYSDLVGEDGSIPTRAGDYSIRQGLTQEPITKQNIMANFPVMHGYIRYNIKVCKHFEYFRI